MDEDTGKSAVKKASHWKDRLLKPSKRLEKFHKRANRVVDRFLDERNQQAGSEGAEFRLNLFHSNITIMTSMLYGSVPKPVVKRTNVDAQDDIARVACVMLERLLDTDLQENGEEWDSVLRSALQDRLVPGLGVTRVRYEMETEEVQQIYTDPSSGEETPIITEDNEPVMETQILWEDAPVDYFYWEDVRWGWSRTWKDVPWVAFRTWMTRDALKARFNLSDQELGSVQFKEQKLTEDGTDAEKDREGIREPKAQVWECWDKEKAEVCFWVPGLSRCPEVLPDPLKLRGFFPCPPFWLANPTTREYMPVPDFYMAQDLYDEIDRLQTRISVITRAIKVVGVFDNAATEVKRMFNETVDNDLIGVENWARFAESGGLAGVIDWMPIEAVANALGVLTQKRDETIQLLYQVTGLSDIMRGAGSAPGSRVSATEQSLKGKFGSVRVQHLQEQFARFAGDLLELKAEVIVNHFEPEEIIRQSNILNTPDADMAPLAVDFMKNDPTFAFRVSVKPESLAMVNFQELQMERTEFIGALATFMQSAVPLVQLDPSTAPPLLQLLQWGLAGFKGSNEIEGVLDRAIEQLQENLGNQQNQQDPEAAREAAKAKAELEKIDRKAAADRQLEAVQARAKMAEESTKTTEIAKRERIKTEEERRRSDIQIETARQLAELKVVEGEALTETKVDGAEKMAAVSRDRSSD